MCVDINKCLGIIRDGEFWIYLFVVNGKCIKIYCYNMFIELFYFVILKNNNSFIIYDEINFLFVYVLNNKCKLLFNFFLKMVEFLKVKV